MNELAKYSPQAIANIQTVEEAKDGYEKLKALVSYFRNDYEQAFSFAVSMIECARRAGELLLEIEGDPGARGNSYSLSDSELEFSDQAGQRILTKKRVIEEAQLSNGTASRWQQIAVLEEDKYQEYLAKFEEIKNKSKKEKLPSISDLLALLKEKDREEDIERQRKEVEGVEPPDGLYDVISIDPPWPYGTKYGAEGRRAANPYPEMSLEEIKAIELPVADDCILWLWTTHKFMRYSFDILDKWGFRDVAIVTWVKDRMGLGTWIRSQSEFCIMAVKGKPQVDLTNQTTVIQGELREHSRKPDSFYEMVDSLCVGYKLDYFSREQREGWMSFGNDTEKF